MVRSYIWYRKADGDHTVAGESEQLRKSVDLSVVQRPRDGVMSVPAASEDALPGFMQLQHWRNDGRVQDQPA